jgi:glucose/mannose transport system permease protein
MWSLPSGLNLESFTAAWSGIPEKGLRGLSRNLLNSFYLTIPATIISAFLGSLNGYVLSKWKFPGANIVFPLLLFGMFIPYQSILIPMTLTLAWVGLGGTLWGLILVHVIYGIPITTLIFRNYYAEVPTDLIEAASIDGAGILGIYWRVMFPLSLPGFVVVIIWQFTNIWNEFLFAVTLLQKPELQPITVALRNLAGSQIKEWNVVMAGALIAAIPTLLIYIILGRFFIRGLLAGSVKG